MPAAGQRVVEQFGNTMAIGPRDVQAVLAAVRPRPFLARQPDRRRVDDGKQLFEVVDEEPVEQHRVVGLQRPQEDVASDVAMRRIELRSHSLQLGVEVFDHGRQQPIEVVQVALVAGECGALVVIPVGEQLAADEHQGDRMMRSTRWRRQRHARQRTYQAGWRDRLNHALPNYVVLCSVVHQLNAYWRSHAQRHCARKSWSRHPNQRR